MSILSKLFSSSSSSISSIPSQDGGIGMGRLSPSSSSSSSIDKRDLIIALIRFGVVAIGSFFLVKWILSVADPTYQEKKRAKVKAQELMSRLGLQGISLNEHEVMIAAHLVDPRELGVCWADVAGLDEQIEEIKKTVIYPILAQKNNIRVSRLVQPPKGVLLYGPPGCGKTLIAKCMAKEAKCWFINLDVSVLTDKWYGESQKLTAAVFSLAEKLQPCIIFIDEIDSLLRLRNSQDHECTAMMKAQFMSLWDGLITDAKKTVIMMGATNRQRDMDAAILRRMAAKFHIPLPDEEMRKRILDLTLKNEVVGKDFDLNKLAKITDGFSGSDLKEVARAAAVACLADMQFGGGKGVPVPVSVPVDVQGSSSEPTLPGGWIDLINPFASSSSVDKDNQGQGQAMERKSSLSALGIRPITMRDFNQAVVKLKESRSHCGNALNQRFTLD